MYNIIFKPIFYEFHKPQILERKNFYLYFKNIIQVIKSKCDHTIKSGINSGKECGRNLPCKYHMKNEIEL